MQEKTFSERIGKSEVKTELQIDHIDKDLKHSLWNVIVRYIIEPLKENKD